MDVYMDIKKVTTALAALGLAFSVSACSGDSASVSFRNGFNAMERGDYEAAEEYYLEAMDAGFDKNDVDELYEIVSNFNNAEECIKNGDYKTAKEYFEDIPRLYKSYEIEDDVEDMEEIIDDYDENIAIYKKAYNFYKSGLYEDSKKAAAEVDTMYLTDIQQQNVDVILNTNTEVQKEEPDDNNPVPDTQVNALMNEYAWNLVDAVNTGDFSRVSHTIYPGSSLYTTQQNLVDNLFRQQISETMDYLTVTGINWTSDTTCTITTNEAAYIHNLDGSSDYRTYSWKYTAKMHNGALKLTSIEKN